ncbi:AAA family ATPase [Cystobacter fuscus]
MNSESTSAKSSESAYPLPSLHIQNFRAFKDLRLDNLGRVNLIVGKNNVGKSTLLEAIALYASGPAVLYELVNLLQARQEFQRPLLQDEHGPVVDLYRTFHSQTHLATSNGTAATCSIAAPPNIKNSISIYLSSQPTKKTHSLLITTNETTYNIVNQSGLGPLITDSRTLERPFSCHFISSLGAASKQLDWLWDSIVLTDREQDVLRSLQIIAPEIERVSLAEGPKTSAQGRVPLVRRTGIRDPEPLRSMGDGMNRVFELALGLANSKDGLFLVDELENGVHYSAQEQLWRLILETASQLNVQVFATTHSWDCIESFQRAASSHPSNGALISLARQEGEVKGTVFNERDLEIITRESIEVR